MTNILIPGRHHLLTNFLKSYLKDISEKGLNSFKDVDNKEITLDSKVDNIIFAVTSSNHSNTRRNPFPFHQRAMAIHEFGSYFDSNVLVYGVDDVGKIDDFADYTIKKIHNQSEGQFNLSPNNTAVLCSTPVLQMYKKNGFQILPCELNKIEDGNYIYDTKLPWEYVEDIAKLENDSFEDELKINVSKSSLRLFSLYNLATKLKRIFSDGMIGDDGDITKTRNYNTYVRSMDENAHLKYNEASEYFKSGRIGDIGCAVGSIIKLASKDPKFRESDFYGVEIARKLYDLCIQRKENGEFDTPYVFFSRKNAVTGLVYEPNSMNTIFTGSLTHEIESYGGRTDLQDFIKNRYEELTTGGVWINRDVIGPENKDKIIYMKLNQDDGSNENFNKQLKDTKKLSEHLEGLSTYSRFLRFAKDFRFEENQTIDYDIKTFNNKQYIEIMLQDACEFLSKKDYVDNWKSEMHETFCFWDINDWKQNMVSEGFKVHEKSHAYTNEWIVNNRFEGKVELYELNNNILDIIEFPVTNMLLIGEKQ